jgi:hypothetical protein
LLPIFLLPLLAFGFLLVSREYSWQPFLYVVLIGAALCAAGMFSLQRSLERLEKLKPIGTEELKQSALPDPVEEEEARARTLVDLPRPRPVHLTSSGRYYIGGVVAVGVVFEVILLWHLIPLLSDLGSEATSAAESWFLLAGAVFFPAMAGIVIYGLARQKQLVVNGEAALAKITRQWQVRGNSWIRYEFTAGGATIAKNAIDVSHRLYTGMRVPVFYDADNLSHQVACCSAYYEIVFPGAP